MKVKDQVITDNYALYCDDCMKVLPGLPDESAGLCIHSPPFSDLYSYSDSLEDVGNNPDYATFFEHYRFLVKELFRLLMPGRVVAVHTMDLPTYKRGGEEIGLRDFPGDIIKLFQSEGWTYHSRFAIWKDPLTAATRTKAIGLAHKQIVKDSTLCRTGILDYVLAFRKPGENPIPVTHPDGLTEYYGSRSIPPHLPTHADKRKDRRSQWIWQKFASPVWDDIRQTRVLPFRDAKDPDDQRHVCPLQRDLIARLLVLYSNPNEIVLDPFNGIGSTVYEAVRMGRKGIGVELKPSYHRQAVRNLRHALRAKQASFV